MQTPQANPDQAPAPTPRPVITHQTGTDVYTVSVPMSAREIAAIKSRREELSDQLVSANKRRSRLMEQLNSTGNETARRGLEDRIALLDKRMLQIETDIATTGQQLSSAPASLLGVAETGSVFPRIGSGQATALSIVFTVVVLGPLAVAAAVIMLRRSKVPAVPPAALTQTAERLERLEQSVDTIAIEIERISEGQRFVTKLLSDGQKIPALASAQRAEPLTAGNG